MLARPPDPKGENIHFPDGSKHGSRQDRAGGEDPEHIPLGYGQGQRKYARSVALTYGALQNFHLQLPILHPLGLQHEPAVNGFCSCRSSALGLHLALYWGPLRFVLRTEPVDLTWSAMIVVAASVLVVVELSKALANSAQRRPSPCRLTVKHPYHFHHLSGYGE